MSQPSVDKSKGTSFFSWFYRARKNSISEEEKDLRRAEFTQRSGRTSPERFRARMAETRKGLYFYISILLVIQFVKVNFLHRHFTIDLWIWIPLMIGPVLQLRVPVTRRLHDVGVSGETFLKPWHAIPLLKLPSDGPNEWGNAPDSIEEKN